MTPRWGPLKVIVTNIIKNSELQTNNASLSENVTVNRTFVMFLPLYWIGPICCILLPISSITHTQCLFPQEVHFFREKKKCWKSDNTKETKSKENVITNRRKQQNRTKLEPLTQDLIALAFVSQFPAKRMCVKTADGLRTLLFMWKGLQSISRHEISLVLPLAHFGCKSHMCLFQIQFPGCLTKWVTLWGPSSYGV